MKDGTMIPCDQVVAKLWEYLDQELAEETSVQVQQHLEICGRCFPQYDFQRAYREYLRQVQRESVPPELRHRIFEAILAEEASNNQSSGVPPSRQGSGLRALIARILGGE
jgi:mycothiol system anti-sigma-R factor